MEVLGDHLFMATSAKANANHEISNKNGTVLGWKSVYNISARRIKNTNPSIMAI